MEPITIYPSFRNISYYLEKYEILDSMFHQKTSSYKLANAIEWEKIHKNLEKIHKNSKDDFWGEWISKCRKKLIEMNEREKLNPGKTIMVFESHKEINNFLTSDFSIKLGRYNITKYEDYVLLYNDKSNMLLYSLEDFNKVIGKISEENLTIIFDNTYQYYIKSIMKNEDLYPLICDEKENIKFFFLDNI